MDYTYYLSSFLKNIFIEECSKRDERDLLLIAEMEKTEIIIELRNVIYYI
ncbi:hypothetical protein [Johnsonella ignava]|nr:hypothetical protein [Johnsonella ignava]